MLRSKECLNTIPPSQTFIMTGSFSTLSVSCHQPFWLSKSYDSKPSEEYHSNNHGRSSSKNSPHYCYILRYLSSIKWESNTRITRSIGYVILVLSSITINTTVLRNISLPLARCIGTWRIWRTIVFKTCSSMKFSLFSPIKYLYFRLKGLSWEKRTLVIQNASPILISGCFRKEVW